MTGKWPVEVDHENGDGNDNRWSNLREASHVQNMANIKKLTKANSSGIKGVSYCKATGKWRAYAGGKSLGYFTSLEAAANVRRAHAEVCYGEFANET
jgi:hypothetical protein